MSAVQGVVNLSGPAGITDQDEFIIIGFTQGFVVRSVGTDAHGQDDQIRGKYGLFAGLRIRDGHFAFFNGCQPHAFPDTAAVLHNLLGQVHDHAGIQISADLVQHLDHGDFIFLCQVFGCLQACNTSADDNDILIFRNRITFQNILRCHRAFNARDGGQDRFSSGRHKDCLYAGCLQGCKIRLHAKAYVNACFRELGLHGLHEFGNHFFVGRNRSKVGSTAEFILCFKQDGLEPAFCQCQRGFHTGGSSADDRHCAACAVLHQLFITVFKFTAKDRVKGTAQGQSVVEDPEAFHAAKAFADQDILAGFGLFAPFGIRQMTAGNTDEIHSAVRQHLFREGRMLNVADSDDGNLNGLADIGSQVDLPAFLEVAGLDDRRAGIVSAAADVDAADAEGFQIFGLSNAVFFRDAVRQVVAAVHTYRNGEFGTAIGFDAHDDFGHKAHAAFKAATVFIGTLVGMGRKELADQVAVGGVDFNSVNPCFLGDHRAGNKFADHGFDFFRCQGPGLLPDDIAGDIRCRNGLPAVDQPAGGLVAGMMELDKDFGIIGVDRFGQAGELGDHMGIGNTQLVGRADAGLVVDPGDLRDDQAGAAPGAVSVVLDHAGAGFAGGLRQGTSHGGHDDAVLELKVPDGTGREEFFV